MPVERATFAAGCFWGVEEVFRRLPGVFKTTVGYTGGMMENPTYDDVCTGNTGHAETVEIEFDPLQISYAKLLTVFWKIHNPTTRDRQGPDIGNQYRSAIFFHTSEQEREAQASKHELESSRIYEHPIVTEIIPASVFYPAEEYHQKYIEKHGDGAACHI